MASEAQKAKDKGNAAFRAENFPEAVGHYTVAILANNADHTLPLNRAAAYLKLGKNADAERDCSTVLRLNPGHVKALYRRAQARSELEKLDEAKADLLSALKLEPGNTAVNTELKRVEELLSERGKKKKKPTPVDTASSDKATAPRRRRVPIEIVESSESSLTAAHTPDTLTPISSRPLIPKPEDALPTPLPSPSREPAPESNTTTTQSKPQEPSEVKSMSRGGIFRSSGEHTLFRPPVASSSPPRTDQSPSKTSPPVKNEADSLKHTPLSLFDFSRTWELASSTERWDLLCKIPPQALPTLFKSSLEASLLVQILEVCSLAVSSTDDSMIKSRVRDYLRWFQRVPRFSTVTLFLSKQEKELGRSLADSVALTEWKV